MARNYLVRCPCGHEGCREVANYEARTRKEQADIWARHGGGKWRCVRHSQPDEVLSPTNRIRVHEVTSRESLYEGRPIGLFWGSFGLIHGPGFKAFAKDFPEGTTIRVTAEAILPAAETEGEG